MKNDAIGQACSLLRAFEFEQARQYLATLAQGEPPAGARPVDYLRDLAQCMTEAGMPAEAGQAWRQAEAAGLPRYYALAGQASAFLTCCDGEKALPFARESADLQKRNPVSLNLHALALFLAGHPGEAIRQWDALLPYSAQSHCPLSTHPFYLALAAMAIERFLADAPATVASNTVAPERAPGASRGRRLEKIEKAWNAGDTDRASAWIEFEVALNLQQGMPLDADLLLVRAESRAAVKDWEGARRDAIEILEKSGDAAPAAKSFYALCLAHQNEPALALSVLERVPPAGPDDFYAGYIRGCAYLAQGDWPRSVRAFQEAFTQYFYDNYHNVLIPAWNRVALKLRQAKS